MQIMKSFAVAVTSAAGVTQYTKPAVADVAWLLVFLFALLFLLVWRKLPHHRETLPYTAWQHLLESNARQCSMGGMMFVVLGLTIALTHYARATVLWPLDAITILGLAMAAIGMLLSLLPMFLSGLSRRFT